LIHDNILIRNQAKIRSKLYTVHRCSPVFGSMSWTKQANSS